MTIQRKKRLLVLYTTTRKMRSLSYVYGYPGALAVSPLFEVTLCNFGSMAPRRWLDRWLASSRKSFDAVVMLHTTSHQMYHFWEDTLRQFGAPIVWFIGNEFRGMPSKMDFAREVGISMLVTQTLSKSVIDIYRDHLGCKVLGLPVSGFDNTVYTPGPPIADRGIDIGYRGAKGPAWLGHWDRETIAEVISEATAGKFNTDITLDLSKRLAWKKWRHFLQNCKTQLCVSSGGEIFELTDVTRLKMEAYAKDHPDFDREEILTLLPPPDERVRLRVLGSRMMEAAATRTPQIMYRDEFDGPMQPNIDYIALNKSHDNLEDVLDRIKDFKYLEQIAKNCEKTLQDFASYPQLLTTFDCALDDIVS